MKIKLFTLIGFIIFAIGSAAGQRPGNQSERPGGPPPGEWIRPQDTNQNGNLEAEEMQTAMDRTFAVLDKNNDGTIDPTESARPPRRNGEPHMIREGEPKRVREGEPRQVRDGQGPGPGLEGKGILPPFFFLDRVQDGRTVNRAEFDRIVRGVFAEMDRNSDGMLNLDEARAIPPRPEGPNLPPNARFIGAELRFGDKLVKGQPFSAESVIVDTRLLLDGTLVKKEIRGNIYRDKAGRTRREMPLGLVGGMKVLGADNKAPLLIFINDFQSRSQVFLDSANKVARRSQLDDIPGRQPELKNRPGATVISDGTKTIEGVNCTATRTEFEIPVGEIGNEKPIKIVDERCFSEELQLVIQSLHHDPVNGIHSFKLVGIRREEPPADLFSIPAGYRIEDQGRRRED